MNIKTTPPPLLPAWLGTKKSRILLDSEKQSYITNKFLSSSNDMSDTVYTNTYDIDLLQHPHKKPAIENDDLQSTTLWIGDLPGETDDPISFELGTLNKMDSPNQPNTYTINNVAWPVSGFTVINFQTEKAKLQKTYRLVNNRAGKNLCFYI